MNTTPPLTSRDEHLGLTALRAVAICLFIGLFLTGLRGGQGLLKNTLYSLTIGLNCYALIEIGRRVAARWVCRRDPGHPQASHRSPGWPWMLGVVVIGSQLGYAIGVTLGNLATGQHLPLPWDVDTHSSIGSLTISLAAGVIVTYLFWLRGRLAATHARAEAAQRVAAQTQLKLLESQLEPHMLFNTLANLRALIAVDPARAQEMLDRLIAFLRSTLSASRATLHPLAAEFERSADYLALMQVRMGARLVARLDLPPALAAHPVPPLLLQPLVENASRPLPTCGSRPWRMAFSTSGCSNSGGTGCAASAGGKSSCATRRAPMRTCINCTWSAMRATRRPAGALRRTKRRAWRADSRSGDRASLARAADRGRSARAGWQAC